MGRSVDMDGLLREQRVIDLLGELDAWYRDQPFHQPSAHPLPHLLTMHMIYHLARIYLLRPYFLPTATLEISPSPAQICEAAAGQITSLLRVSHHQKLVRVLRAQTFDATHEMKFGVATISA